eukprot:Pompholyxophrys_punicea_v1_NODE_250_length_2534_cov_2.806374.p4 type:complete len:116 gc:universal NODE_250_length_2534_cov_2.806374:2010-1663(-)
MITARLGLQLMHFSKVLFMKLPVLLTRNQSPVLLRNLLLNLLYLFLLARNLISIGNSTTRGRKRNNKKERISKKRKADTQDATKKEKKYRIWTLEEKIVAMEHCKKFNYTQKQVD